MSTAELAAPAPGGPSQARRFGVATLRLLNKYSFGFALLLTIALLAANLARSPDFGWSDQLANLAPLAIAAMASTPAILSGGGGFDLSISPVMILVAGVYIVQLAPNGLGGAEAVPIMLALGAAVGMLNGLLITFLRLAPVVVTLATWFFFTGLDLRVIAAPKYGASTWITHLADTIGPIPGALFTIGLPLVIWVLLGLLPYRRLLLSVGSNDAAAFSSGVNIDLIRIAAYALGGLFAGIGAFAVIALSNTASAGLATTYTLPAIAAVTLGGTSLWGGRGGLIGSLLGAASIYLLGNLLITLNVNPSWLQVMYGLMLLLAVSLVGAAALTKRPA